MAVCTLCVNTENEYKKMVSKSRVFLFGGATALMPTLASPGVKTKRCNTLKQKLRCRPYSILFIKCLAGQLKMDEGPQLARGP